MTEGIGRNKDGKSETKTNMYGMCTDIENLVMQINCCLKAKYTELAIADDFEVLTTQAEPYQPDLQYMYNRYLIVRDMSRHSYNNDNIILAGP